MGEHPRMSKQTLQLLAAMLEDPQADWFGLQLSRITRILPGTLYPILHRLERAGWLDARTEAIDPVQERRPARRLYRLTGKGELAARARLEHAPAVMRRTLKLRGQHG